MLRLFASKEARDTVRLFEEQPEEWTTDAINMGEPYFAIHSSGFAVWVANKAYGLKLLPCGRRYSRTSLWDVTYWCLIGGSPSQKVVWRAYRRWLRAHPQGPNLKNQARTSVRLALARALGRYPAAQIVGEG